MRAEQSAVLDREEMTASAKKLRQRPADPEAAEPAGDPSHAARASPAMVLPPVCTVAEAARLLRVNPKTLYAEISAGRIHVLRFGRALRIPRAVLEALCAGKASAGR